MPIKFEYSSSILESARKAIEKNHKIAEEIKNRISSSILGGQEVRIEVGQNHILVNIDKRDENPFTKNIYESDLQNAKPIADHFFMSHKEPENEIKNIITETIKELIPKNDH